MAPSKAIQEMTHSIQPGLVSLAFAIDQLSPDPRNARLHDDPNVRAIMDSLRIYGQRRPVVVNKGTNIVEAGNGLVEAAKRLGWTHVAALWVEDDKEAATGYALADNRTAELSAWNDEQLAHLLQELSPEMIVGWNDSEIDDLLAKLEAEAPFADDGGTDAAFTPNPIVTRGTDETGATPALKLIQLWLPYDQYDGFVSRLRQLASKREQESLSDLIQQCVEETLQKEGF